MITGAVTYGLEGDWIEVIFAACLGLTLAMGGFYLDYLADYKKDKLSGKLSNPIARGTFPIPLAIIVTSLAIIGSYILGWFANPWTWIPISCLFLVITGLAIGLLDTPFLRALSLGLLQGLYVLIGGIVTERYDMDVWFLAIFLLFAMMGGRAAGDTRDLPHDEKLDVKTLPKKYGPRGASIFMLINQLFAYAFAIAAYFVGIGKIAYLYCMIVLVVIGLVLSILFVIKPTPKIANIVNMISFGLLGMLFILGLILGRLTPIS
jgi:4-hydroxybenzoate polyprenyltransferase